MDAHLIGAIGVLTVVAIEQRDRFRSTMTVAIVKRASDITTLVIVFVAYSISIGAFLEGLRYGLSLLFQISYGTPDFTGLGLVVFVISTIATLPHCMKRDI